MSESSDYEQTKLEHQTVKDKHNKIWKEHAEIYMNNMQLSQEKLNIKNINCSIGGSNIDKNYLDWLNLWTEINKPLPELTREQQILEWKKEIEYMKNVCF